MRCRLISLISAEGLLTAYMYIVHMRSYFWLLPYWAPILRACFLGSWSKSYNVWMMGVPRYEQMKAHFH